MERARTIGCSDVAFSLADVLEAVPVSLSQVAEWTGVSRRQLAYWISRGILPAEQRVSAATLQRAVLIKAELDRKQPLRRAAAKAAAQLEAATALGELEEQAPIDEVSRLIRQRIDDCLAALESIDNALESASPDEVERVSAVIRQFRRALGGGDRLPMGFLALADRFVELLSEGTALPVALSPDETPVTAGAS